MVTSMTKKKVAKARVLSYLCYMDNILDMGTIDPRTLPFVDDIPQPSPENSQIPTQESSLEISQNIFSVLNLDMQFDFNEFNNENFLPGSKHIPK